MKVRLCFPAFVLCLALAGSAQGAERESVLDRKVHIEKDLVLKIPDVPPLCDSTKALKQYVQRSENGNAGDCKLYVERQGKGIPIVLLHGGPGATHHLFHPDFSRAARFAEIVYYDQRGCGSSSYAMPTKGYSVEQAADDLEALRTALKIDRWIVLGHSYGGTLARCYTAKYPEHVAAMVLVCSSEDGLPIELKQSRQNLFISKEEAQRIRDIFSQPGLTMAQCVFNAQMNGDWKRQNFYRPTREQLARMALYEWKHNRAFRSQTCQSLSTLDFGGVFDDCPIPVLIIEAAWDLTWNTDKPGKLKSCFPNAKLVILDHSGHSPFADEPKKFFAVLKDFVKTLSPVSDTDVAAWRIRVNELTKEKQKSPAYLLKTSGWGRASSKKIADMYSPDWLSQVSNSTDFLRLGFALYDMKRFEDALAVFQKMAEKTEDVELAMARIWQAHMLDLLGRRSEAVTLYREVVDMKCDSGIQHSQYGLTYAPSQYAAEKLDTPFVYLENQDLN